MTTNSLSVGKYTKFLITTKQKLEKNEELPNISKKDGGDGVGDYPFT